MGYCKAATLDDLWSGEIRGVVLQGRRVLLVNVEGTVCAYHDRCRHKGVPLSSGRLEGEALTCSVHGWVYDARTGCGINPDGVNLTRYALKIEGNDILVDLGEEESDEQPL